MRWLLAVLAFAAPALADEVAPDPQSAALESQMVACLNMPAGSAEDFVVRAEVTLEGGSVTRIEVLSYSPQSDAGKGVAEAIVRAVQRCTPYRGISGTVLLEYTTADFFGAEPSAEVVMPN